jgi:hypothetical protein
MKQDELLLNPEEITNAWNRGEKSEDGTTALERIAKAQLDKSQRDRPELEKALRSLQYFKTTRLYPAGTSTTSHVLEDEAIEAILAICPVKLERPELEKALRKIITHLAVGMMIIVGCLKPEDLDAINKERYEQICTLTLNLLLALLDPEAIRKEERERIKILALQSIADELEYPSEMPDELWEELDGNRDNVQKALQSAVRLTKNGITDRFLSALRDGKDGS